MNNTNTSFIKTLIVCVWLGNWPDYIKYFLKSISTQTDYNWLIVSDQATIPYNPDNMLFVHMTVQEINDLASRKLGFPVIIKDPRKLCDLKPCFGRIFDDHFKDYDYWGYCDIDLVLGNMTEFINPILMDKPDVISFYGQFMSGPLCLYRNTEEINLLFEQAPEFREIIQDESHYAFDENNLKMHRKTQLHRRIMLKVKYLLRVPFKFRGDQLNASEIRYQFQWFLKWQSNRSFAPADMTDVVIRSKHSGRITSHFQDLLHSDREFLRKGRKNWKLKWENGVLYDENRRREIMGFHFVELKSKEGIQPPETEDVPDAFILTETGFRT